MLTSPQELYGAERTSTITAALSRLFTGFIQRFGFTCGMSDVFLVSWRPARWLFGCWSEGWALFPPAVHMVLPSVLLLLLPSTAAQHAAAVLPHAKDPRNARFL